jgi:two-component system CheB/CheR fusion protein
VARVAQGKIDLRRRPVDLRAVVDVALQSERMRFADKAQRFAVDVPEDPVVVDGDRARLQQIVGNLLNNAAKYTPAGGAISVTLHRAAGEAVVRVQDTGVGIPPDRIGTIFKLFSQLHTELSRSAGGLGIGLSLVKRLVEMHGGTVDVHSEGEGRGSCFTITLPLAPEQTMLPEPTSTAEPKGRGWRILLIEDNADAREVLRLGLELEGQHVDVAADGEAGIAQARANGPDVVLVDIGLPDVDGYEVARRIRKAQGPRLFLIALTGYGQAEDRRRAAEAGFDAHLTKPVTVKEILRLLS